MKKIFFSILMVSLIAGCSKDDGLNLKFDPPPDENVQNEKARSEFLKQPIIQDFLASGLPVDCELSICGQISSSTLEKLKGFKSQFIQKIDRIHKITLVKEDYPIYDYRLEGAYIPAQLTEGILTEFFEVLDTIRNFESEVGFRIEFPNSRHLKRNIMPLLQILKDNKSSLQAVANRLDILVISSVYNQFYPGHKMLMLKMEDLRASFAELWSFMNLFFKAQDLFGDISFDFDKGDVLGEATMNILFNQSAKFIPLLDKLQGRRIALFSWDNFYAYSDAHKFLKDLGVSSSYDERYLEEVFRDQIRVIEISEFIGKRLSHSNSIIELSGHNECLNKIDTLKTHIKEKVSAINDIEIGSGQYVPNDESSFQNGKLYLNCNQSVDSMGSVIKEIN